MDCQPLPFNSNLMILVSNDQQLKHQQIFYKEIFNHNSIRIMEKRQQIKKLKQTIFKRLPKLKPNLNFDDKVNSDNHPIDKKLASIMEGDEYAKNVLRQIQNDNKSDESQEIKTALSSDLLIGTLLWNICRSNSSNPKKRNEMFNVLYPSLKNLKIFQIANDQSMNYPNDLRQIQRFSRDLNNTVRKFFGLKQRNLRQITYEKSGTDNYYLKTFDEIETIAHGGFGIVKKARHRIDGCEYAIKQITISDSQNKKIKNKIDNFLKEVKFNATLENENIVSYKTSWLEYISYSNDSECSNNSNTSDTTNLSTDKSNENLQPSKSNDAIKSKFYNRSSSSSSSKSSKLSNSNSNENYKPEIKKLTLFIVMELCGQNLETYLRERNNKCLLKMDLNKEISYFKQILNGVKYLHQKNLIHRDLKPSNILFSLDGKQIKIADFGLSARSRFNNDSSSKSFKLSNEIGTRVYGAPEQLSVNSNYDNRVDIYSLGIILFEMVHPMNTDSEKSKCLDNLKKNRKLPESFTDLNDGILAKLIIPMTETKPKKRPKDIQIILDRLSSTEESSSSIEYKNKIRNLELENEKLRRALKIANLKNNNQTD